MGMAPAAIAGFNSFLDKQRGQPDCDMTVVIFDHEYTVLESNVPVDEVKPLTDKTFVPRGATALLDAVGRAICEVGSHEKVIVVILTDGQENSSKEFSGQSIKSLIEEKTEGGWEFIYLSSNMSAVTDGESIGIKSANIVKTNATQEGTRSSYDVTSEVTRHYTEMGRIDRMIDGMPLQEAYDKKEDDGEEEDQEAPVVPESSPPEPSAPVVPTPTPAQDAGTASVWGTPAQIPPTPPPEPPEPETEEGT
jgi:hypothetical protein